MDTCIRSFPVPSRKYIYHEDKYSGTHLQSLSHNRQRILEMKSMSRLYSRMIKSVAPTIFGHEDIKRGVLLMLVGGVHKSTKDGASLRTHICALTLGFSHVLYLPYIGSMYA